MTDQRKQKTGSWFIQSANRWVCWTLAARLVTRRLNLANAQPREFKSTPPFTYFPDITSSFSLSPSLTQVLVLRKKRGDLNLHRNDRSFARAMDSADSQTEAKEEKEPEAWASKWEKPN